jgi:hypothetical protein
MNTQSHSTTRTMEYAYSKKGITFSERVTSLTSLFKLRSSRGYGSRKSAYSYYMRNT